MLLCAFYFEMAERNLATLQREKDMERQRGHWPETMDRAIENWGIETQTDKAIEEMGELMQAIMKHRHKPLTHDRRRDLLEEIADVEIMLSQLKRMYDPEGNVDHFKIVKMFRLKNILDNGGLY